MKEDDMNFCDHISHLSHFFFIISNLDFAISLVWWVWCGWGDGLGRTNQWYEGIDRFIDLWFWFDDLDENKEMLMI